MLRWCDRSQIRPDTLTKVTRKVLVNGRELLLTLDGEDQWSAGGESGRCSLTEVEPGVWSVLIDGRSHEVSLRTPGEASVDGYAIPIEVVDPRAGGRAARKAGTEGPQTLKASMPGKIIRVLVQQGEMVASGQGIIVIEAMKMQNEVKAPRAGVVIRIEAREGATVKAGSVLAVVE